jgi:hypothetical protein
MPFTSRSSTIPRHQVCRLNTRRGPCHLCLPASPFAYVFPPVRPPISLGRWRGGEFAYRGRVRWPRLMRLQTNAVAVAKKAKQMIFGFKAMDALKTHSISYMEKNAYERYFRSMESEYNTVYFEPSDKAEGLTATTVAATAVMLAPFLLLGAKIFVK